MAYRKVEGMEEKIEVRVSYNEDGLTSKEWQIVFEEIRRMRAKGLDVAGMTDAALIHHLQFAGIFLNAGLARTGVEMVLKERGDA